MRYWKRLDEQGNIRTVESYSHNADIEGAMEITEEEHDAFIGTLPIPETKPSELELVKARLDVIEKQIGVQ